MFSCAVFTFQVINLIFFPSPRDTKQCHVYWEIRGRKIININRSIWTVTLMPFIWEMFTLFGGGGGGLKK